MGMINQFGKFSSKLAELTEPLRQLLSKKNSWSLGHPQDQVFAKVKLELMKPTVLALFDKKWLAREAFTKLTTEAILEMARSAKHTQ